MVKVSKHKSLFTQLTFNQNQFYKINSDKINFVHRITKHTLSQSMVESLTVNPFTSFVVKRKKSITINFIKLV